jgi:hypothetical protein
MSTEHSVFVERFVPESMGGTLIEAEHLCRYYFAAS